MILNLYDILLTSLTAKLMLIRFASGSKSALPSVVLTSKLDHKLAIDTWSVRTCYLMHELCTDQSFGTTVAGVGNYRRD